MGPRGFWIALGIVLFYLIARPHVGTVWHLTQEQPSPTETLPPGLTPITPTPPPGFGPGVRFGPTPTTSFIDQRDCYREAIRFEGRTGTSGVYCAPSNALLWGW